MLSKGSTFLQSFTVSEDVYRGFLDAFNDRNPYHTDDAAARAAGFPGRIMHGNILCGFLSYFVGECLPTKAVVLQSQEIAFHQPVFLNDTVTLRAEVTEVIESVRCAQFRFTFENQHHVRVAKGKLQIGLL